MNHDIVFAPLVDVSLLWLSLALTVATCGYAAWIRVSGWALRTAAMMCIVMALAQPSFRQRDTQPLDDVVLIVEDRTASQALEPRAEQTDRVGQLLRDQLTQLPNLTVQTISVSDSPSNQGTQVFEAISQAQVDIPARQLSSIFILSDGQVHDVPNVVDFGIPVHHIVTGTRNEYDRKITITNAPAYAILGEPVKMTVRIDDVGNQMREAEPVVVKVNLGGGARYEFPTITGRETELELNLTHAGQTIFEFRVEPIAGELTTENNTTFLSVNAIRDRLRVLLVSGLPHAGARVWRNLLKSDSSVDLVHFTILRPPEKQDGVPVSELSLIAFPTRELFLEKIDDFDLIIFDRYKRRGILPNAYLDNIATYVEQGGAVLIAAGPDFASAQSLARTPLDRILPGRASALVRRDSFKPAVTDLGQRHPVTADLPGQETWGPWARQLDLELNRGQVLMEGADERPLLILDRVGQGRVALLASDHVWLWYRQFQGGGPQQELLRRMAHWLMKEPDLEEETLIATQIEDGLLIKRRTLAEIASPVLITKPNGDRVTQNLLRDEDGQFSSTFQTDDQGIFQLSDGTLSIAVSRGVVAPIELNEALATPARLAPIVATTRGGQVWADEMPLRLREVKQGRPAAGRGWLGVLRRDAKDVVDIKLRPLLPVWAALLLILGLILAAWLREGRRASSVD